MRLQNRNIKMIYAKPDLGLINHLKDVKNTAQKLFECGFFDSLIDKFNLDKEEFKKNLYICAYTHDFGKAGEDFQKLMKSIQNNKDRFIQRIRHEHVSAYILFKLKDWLEEEGVNPAVIISVVLSHHLKAPGKYNKKTNYYNLVNIPEFESNILKIYPNVIKNVIKNIGVGKKFINQIPKEIILERNEFKKINTYLEKTKTKFTEEDILFINALKVALICSDSLGSAYPDNYNDKNIDEFIKNNICLTPLKPEDIQKDIINEIINKIPNFKFNNMQKDIIKYSNNQNHNRVLLLDSCGSGKTLAAYLWAKYVVEKNKNINHIIFNYPTKSTATEGFIQYLLNDKSVLLHSSVIDDLKRIEDFESEEKKQSFIDRLITLESFGQWGNRYFSSTIDQFAYMEYYRGGILKLPIMLNSAIIIDEIHSYDERMLNNLIAFIEMVNEDVPILLMSATIPSKLLNRFKKLGFLIKPNNNLKVIEKESSYKKYKVENINVNDVYNIVNQCKERKEKVLIITNQVNSDDFSCISLYKKLKEFNPICFHSRFKSEDRSDVHRKVIDSFKKEGFALSITTQVAEMSLDIDADVLITAYAHPCSMIQRMGRLCRKINKYGTDGRVGHCYIFKPENSLPYSEEDINNSIKIFNDGNYSQQDLSEELQKINFKMFEGKSHIIKFLDKDVWETFPGSFRNEDDFMVSAILESDLKNVFNNGRIDKQNLKRNIIKIPISRAKSNKVNIDENINEKLNNIFVIDDLYESKIGYYG